MASVACLGRKAFLAMVIGGLLALPGCGGSKSKEATVDTGTDGGSLYDVQVTPAPGTTFISSNTEFRLFWPDSAPPPATFTAALKRYREARGEEARIIETQRTELNRQGTSYTWKLQRADDFALESGGVYFIELNSGPEQVTFSYIISSDRSTPVHSPESAKAADTKENAADLEHTITVR